MTNQDTLREIQRGHRLEKPDYPGDVSPKKLNAIYKVRILLHKILIQYYEPEFFFKCFNLELEKMSNSFQHL